MKKICIIGIVLLAVINNAYSQFLGEIRIMSTNFAPKGWAKCEGQLLSINQNQALYSLLGTKYGGNGTTTFALPDLRGKVAVGKGDYLPQGQIGGSETVTITSDNIPAHSHYEEMTMSSLTATLNIENQNTGLAFAAPAVIVNNAPRTALAYTAATPNVALAGTETTSNGGVQSPTAITNVQPYIALTYMISLQGIYPSRN